MKPEEEKTAALAPEEKEPAAPVPKEELPAVLIEAKDLTLGYETGVVVQDLSFTVRQGDYLCIVGENGSGKSTLVKSLLKLRAPMGGELIFGDGLTGREIGYLPQQTDVQRDFPASVREIVLSGCQGRCGLRPFYNREEKQLAADNMARMGLTDLADHCYRELSGGQQQRVLLARALCATRKLLLLDEPVTGLDPHAAAQLYQWVRQLNEEGLTVIMVSHDIGAALRDATHILHLGKENYFGTKESYQKSEAGKLFFERKGGEEDA